MTAILMTMTSMPEAVLLTLTAFGSGWALCWLRETYRQDAERLMRQRAREETERHSLGRGAPFPQGDQ